MRAVEAGVFEAGQRVSDAVQEVASRYYSVPSLFAGQREIPAVDHFLICLGPGYPLFLLQVIKAVVDSIPLVHLLECPKGGIRQDNNNLRG